jgi:CrcB protein
MRLWMRSSQPACTISAHGKQADLMSQTVAIAAGGALGALLRYWTSTAVHGRLGSAFPYGTLTVNIIGSLLMGFLYIWLTDRLASAPAIRAFLIIGLLGAFTTFSTFSMETLNLVESGHPGKALANVFISVTVCFVAASAGVFAARQL